MFYIHKTPIWLKGLYPSLMWNIETEDKKIYLTFDDGPVPEVTPFVLKTLQKYDAYASFFCVGDNIRKHPEISEEAFKQGHVVANHTFHHIKGWNTSLESYLADIQKCQNLLEPYSGGKINLFRPPYGRISFNQIKQVKKTHQIVMWDVLTGDYNASLAADRILKNIIKATKPGSIIVFHDSIKAYPRLKEILPAYLQYFKDQGFCFETLYPIQND